MSVSAEILGRPEIFEQVLGVMSMYEERKGPSGETIIEIKPDAKLLTFERNKDRMVATALRRIQMAIIDRGITEFKKLLAEDGQPPKSVRLENNTAYREIGGPIIDVRRVLAKEQRRDRSQLKKFS